MRYRALDAVGNQSALATATVRVDNSAPATSDDAPDEWVTGPVSLHLGATDALSGLDGILYSTDGSLPSLLVTGPITVSAEGTTSVRTPRP